MTGWGDRLVGARRWAGKQLDRLSTGGWLFGLLFFALSLTPSLIPRHFSVQGILCGFAFAAGYAIGVSLEWLWNFLELRWPNRRVARWVGRLAAGACLVLAIAFLWFSTGWQNSIRAAMGIAPVEARQPLLVAAIAVVPAAVLIGIGTMIVHGVRLVWAWMAQAIPTRMAFVLALITVGLATATVGNGVVARGVLYVADRFYGQFDRLAGSAEPQPAESWRSGSQESLIPWDTIGLDARIYVESGPTAEEITTLTGRGAITPLRIYVGLRASETAAGRAQLALAEMDRVRAFDRSVLVLIMPVGTGWVEPAAIDTLEMLHGGDIASVAVQYSYLTSWLSLVSEPDVGVETARALFAAVYERWTDMPEETRPKLYLHGLSLGAYSSAASASLYDVLGDPFDGALWVGTPFATTAWRTATANRDPESPFWLPQVGDNTAVRFANSGEDLSREGWGPLRIVYLQYPTDPIVFFDPGLLYREPAWLSGERAPTVSPLLNWYPVVTFLQLALDMALAQTSPIGFGHVYAPQDYLDGWIAVTDPPGWTTAALDDLRERLTRHGDRELIEAGWFRESLAE
ncbi:alpha/beta hydrolase [Devosia albogilva]|uniref:Alpha/beta hydrolase n=1 Tax=Devosia albogilva TaxID=429726 RepID=A0ABW5QKA5_9HYPH